MPRWHKVRALAAKEFRDIIRDRRTIFMAIIFPLILYPLLIIGFIQTTVVQEGRARKERQVIALSGGGFAPELEKRFADLKAIRVVEFDGTPESLKAVGAGAGVVIPEDFAEKLAANSTAEVKIIYDSASEKSQSAYGRAADVVHRFSRDVLAGRLKAASLDRAFIEPVDIDDTDIATPRQRGVFRLGRVLAFLLVIFCMMGALYPALDAVAGEKERGTLETLLSVPATRLEVLAGKYVAVTAMSIASVAANFAGLAATMLLVNSLLAGAAGGKELPVDFTVPASAVIYMIPALVPLAALFSALSLGVASFARSTREGQYYLGPLYAACLPLTAAAMMPNLRLTWVTAFVPVMSISLFLKGGLLGALAAGPAILALLLQCVYAFFAIKWAAAVFAREDVLFGSTSDSAAFARTGYARAAHVVFAWIVSVILFFFVGSIIGQHLGPVSVVTGVLNYGFFVVGPALTLYFLGHIDLRKIAPLRRPAPRAWASLLLFAPGAVLVGIGLNGIGRILLPPPVGADGLAKLQETVSPWALVVSLAILPAVCEEFFYRGLVYRSFASRMRPTTAIALSSALFAAAHLNPYELLPLFGLGVVLALVARSAGTLVPPMIVHFLNNGLTVLVMIVAVKWPASSAARLLKADLSPWGAILVVLGGAGCVMAALRIGAPKDEAASRQQG